jgi:hypothetical protein
VKNAVLKKGGETAVNKNSHVNKPVNNVNIVKTQNSEKESTLNNNINNNVNNYISSQTTKRRRKQKRRRRRKSKFRKETLNDVNNCESPEIFFATSGHIIINDQPKLCLIDTGAKTRVGVTSRD